MDYTTPSITDYGDVAQLTAAQNFLNIGDDKAGPQDVLGIENSTGPCPTGQKSLGGICVPIIP